MVNTWPAMVIVPSRRAVGFGATLKAIVPTPLPELGPVIRIQSADANTIQLHALVAVTLIVPVPPLALNVELVCDNSGGHAAGACAISTRWPDTATVPRRTAGFGFGATEYSTIPSPFPVVEVIEIQLTSFDAVQEHSRGAVTVMTPVPPLALIDGVEFATPIVHFVSDGPVMVVEVDPHVLAATANAMTDSTGQKDRGSSKRPGKAGKGIPSKFDRGPSWCAEVRSADLCMSFASDDSVGRSNLIRPSDPMRTAG